MQGCRDAGTQGCRDAGSKCTTTHAETNVTCNNTVWLTRGQRDLDPEDETRQTWGHANEEACVAGLGMQGKHVDACKCMWMHRGRRRHPGQHLRSRTFPRGGHRTNERPTNAKVIPPGLLRSENPVRKDIFGWQMD